jgi:hypothetical protein
MRATRRVAILTKYPRHPDAEYHVEAASSPGYVYVKMFRSGRREPTSPTLYNVANMPKWMTQGVQMLDLAYDPNIKEGVIPGFGQLVGGKYTFYKQTQ